MSESGGGKIYKGYKVKDIYEGGRLTDSWVRLVDR